MYVLAGRPALARPYVGVHRSTSLMNSSLLLQLFPACLVRLTWIVFVMGGRWPYNCCFVRCCVMCLILIATFLCSCRLASSPAILLASKWCIHTAVSTRPRLGRTCVDMVSVIWKSDQTKTLAYINRMLYCKRTHRLYQYTCDPYDS